MTIIDEYGERPGLSSKVNNMEVSFSIALEALKNKKSIRLPYWSDDVFLSLQVPDEHSKMTAPYIYVTSRFGVVPWVATQIEMLSENWVIIE